MFWKKFVATAMLLWLPIALFAANNYAFPLKHTPGQRWLSDSRDQPFLWVGDAAWSLLVELPTADALRYLDDRQRKGFNVLLVNLIEHRFSTHAPANFYGEPPFAGKPFVTPNEAYFAHADSVIGAAAQRGIAVLLCPLYLGYECGADGFCAETAAAAPEDLRFWGRFVGERYAPFDNIIWCIGGDTDPTPVKDKVLECVYGILETDSRHLFTAHNHPESQAISPWPNEAWLSVNNVYTYDISLYQQCKAAWERKPVMPYFMMESAYENEHEASAVRLRSQAYWPMLCGAMGQIYGNCPMWHFGGYPSWCSRDDWQAQLDSPGAVSMSILAKLFDGRPWHLLIPDFEHQLLTDGYGHWGTPDYAAAACTPDGTLFIAYLPSGRTVTVDLKKLAGELSLCAWYDPRTGEYQEISVLPNNGKHAFTAPSTDDWVLVIEGGQSGTPVEQQGRRQDLPLQFALLPNMPNPANPATQLSFVIAATEQVRLSIFDRMGRRVQILLNESKAPGRHCVSWDGSGTASGVYFACLEAGGFKAARKIVLVK